MKHRLRTLYLTANGVGSQIILVDTVLRGIFSYREGDRPPAMLRRYPYINLLFAELRDVNAQLSYSADWRDAFVNSPDLAVEVCNINNLVHFGRCLLGLRKYDLIVVSHVAAGDDMTVLARAAGWFHRRRAPMVLFIGNEYDLLDDKLKFIRETGVEFVCSQLPLAAAEYLYQKGANSRLIEMPHALNADKYRPLPGASREIDIGFIGDIYWPFVGDRERTDLIEWFEKHGADQGLSCDIRKQRVGRDEWVGFLNGCKAIVGAESGTYYLNDCGGLLERARAYNLFENRDASFEEVFNRFYRDQPCSKSGKSISSRHFEAIGTKTCQILIDGDYNGILQADQHYIAVNKDLSNIDEALEKFRDESYRTRMVEATYDYVLSQHTYAHRVERLLTIIGENSGAIRETAAHETAVHETAA